MADAKSPLLMQREEHDSTLLAKKTSLVSAATVYAVVNTSAAGDPKTFIGLTTSVIGSAPTLYAVVNTAAAGQSSIVLDNSISKIGFATVNVAAIAAGSNAIGKLAANSGVDIGDVDVTSNTAWTDPGTYIGLVTITGSLDAAAGNVTLDPGSKTGIVGNVTISDSKTYIGLVTATLGVGTAAIGKLAANSGVDIGDVDVTSNTAWANPNTYIGLVTANIGTIKAWADPNTYIGLVTAVVSSIARSIVGNVTLTNSQTYIGLVTARPVGLTTVVQTGNTTVWQASSERTITGNVTLSDAKTYIGLTTSTLGIGTQFIGLVTAWTRNAGTTKTLISKPVGLGNNSLLTIAVPTNANKINVTNFVLGSNVTTEVAIKSGVTYLTGNASLGVTLFPGGGFELPGSPDSPSWIGLPSGAMVVEKRDGGGTVSKIGGGIIYFDE